MPRILDGNRVRDEIKSELKPRVDALAAKGRPPGLAVVLVGNNPASEIYVRNKIKTCRDLGIYSESITPPDSISTAELLAIVEGLNARAEILPVTATAKDGLTHWVEWLTRALAVHRRSDDHLDTVVHRV